MEEVKTWFSSEVAQMFDEAELKDIESHARELVEADGETWSALHHWETHSAFHHWSASPHHRGSIPIEFKLDDDILYIF